MLRPADVRRLIRTLLDRHDGSAPEITLEANPENLTPARCHAWRDAGITRLSIGVQSFQTKDLERLERLHTPELIPQVVENARLAGFENISLDLMFALPGQTLNEWRDNLRAAIALRPQHISFYGLTIHENTPFFDERRAGKLREIDDELQAEMYLWGSRFLRDEGFEHYEISNFAVPGFRSVHNQRYWNKDDVVGLGPGAHSNLGAWRWFNPDDLDGWREGLRAGSLPRAKPSQLDEEGDVEEELFRRLRRAEGFSSSGGGASPKLFFEWLDTGIGRQAENEGWIAREGKRARLTPEGWLRSDAILLSILGMRRVAG